MPVHEYGFDERMAMSSGYAESANIKDILKRHIPGAVNVVRASARQDREGTDWWVEMLSGHRLSVDAKVREVDWAASHPGEDDLALETWSVVDSKPGWTRDETKRTDYILWLWKDTGRFCLVPFPFLCHVFQLCWISWKTKFKTCRQRTPRDAGTYLSECTFVPRELVWRAIRRAYGGRLHA